MLGVLGVLGVLARIGSGQLCAHEPVGNCVRDVASVLCVPEHHNLQKPAIPYFWKVLKITFLFLSELRIQMSPRPLPHFAPPADNVVLNLEYGRQPPPPLRLLKK